MPEEYCGFQVNVIDLFVLGCVYRREPCAANYQGDTILKSYLGIFSAGVYAPSAHPLPTPLSTMHQDNRNLRAQHFVRHEYTMNIL